MGVPLETKGVGGAKPNFSIALTPLFLERGVGGFFWRCVKIFEGRSAGGKQMWPSKQKGIKNGDFGVKIRTAETENREPKKMEKQKTGAETTDETPTHSPINHRTPP